MFLVFAKLVFAMGNCSVLQVNVIFETHHRIRHHMLKSFFFWTSANFLYQMSLVPFLIKIKKTNLVPRSTHRVFKGCSTAAVQCTRPSLRLIFRQAFFHESQLKTNYHFYSDRQKSEL